MRVFATRVKYPAWAELVPSVAALTDALAGSSRLERWGGGQACFSLTLLQMPRFFDPLSETEGQAQHLNALVTALRERAIPFDMDTVDIDRPWRNTTRTTFLRRTTDLELIEYPTLGREPPLEWVTDAHSAAANVLAAVLMDPSYFRFDIDLGIVEGLAPQICREHVPIVLVAAGRSRRVADGIARLTAAGLAINDDAYGQAIDAVQTLGDGSATAVWDLRQARSHLLCRGLMASLGVRALHEPRSTSSARDVGDVGDVCA